MLDSLIHFFFFYGFFLLKIVAMFGDILSYKYDCAVVAVDRKDTYYKDTFMIYE